MNLDNFYKNLAENIKLHRKKASLTQEQLAEKANLSVDYIGKIETCKNKPGLMGLFKIINALQLSIREFFITFKD